MQDSFEFDIDFDIDFDFDFALPDPSRVIGVKVEAGGPILVLTLADGIMQTPNRSDDETVGRSLRLAALIGLGAALPRSTPSSPRRGCGPPPPEPGGPGHGTSRAAQGICSLQHGG